jgi:hypothetical protein
MICQTSTKKSTNQESLDKQTTQIQDWHARKVAIEKLTNQVVLAKIAIGDKNPYIRQFAVWKLTDQALLIKVASQTKDSMVRQAAVKKLTDQAVLAEFATEDKDSDVRQAAMVNLTDQALLAKIAIEDKYPVVRRTAVWQLSNEAVVAKIAIEDCDSSVRNTAVEKIIDDELSSPILRAKVISRLEDSNPILIKIAGNKKTTTHDPMECIARIKLAIQQSRIQSRLPGLRCFVIVRDTSCGYRKTNSVDVSLYLPGEWIHIELRQYGTKLVEASWKTEFSSTVPITISGPDKFQSAYVYGESLLEKLLHLSVFTSEDLAELIHSSIPEVVIGAVNNLTDQALLVKVATEGSNCFKVRKAARDRIKNLTLEK